MDGSPNRGVRGTPARYLSTREHAALAIGQLQCAKFTDDLGSKYSGGKDNRMPAEALNPAFDLLGMAHVKRGDPAAVRLHREPLTAVPFGLGHVAGHGLGEADFHVDFAVPIPLENSEGSRHIGLRACEPSIASDGA